MQSPGTLRKSASHSSDLATDDPRHPFVQHQPNACRITATLSHVMPYRRPPSAKHLAELWQVASPLGCHTTLALHRMERRSSFAVKLQCKVRRYECTLQFRWTGKQYSSTLSIPSHMDSKQRILLRNRLQVTLAFEHLQNGTLLAQHEPTSLISNVCQLSPPLEIPPVPLISMCLFILLPTSFGERDHACHLLLFYVVHD